MNLFLLNPEGTSDFCFRNCAKLMTKKGHDFMFFFIPPFVICEQVQDKRILKAKMGIHLFRKLFVLSAGINIPVTKNKLCPSIKKSLVQLNFYNLRILR